MRKAYLSLIFIVLFQNAFSIEDGSNDRTKYIEKWKDVAMKQMKLHGIPASITLAQGILESRNGQSELTQKSNNHFGIKCHGWKGKKVYADDDKKNECFRKYKDADQSFEDHSQFLLRKRYASLFDLKQSDYKGWAKGLRKAGYATDPAYAKLLIKLIEENDLKKYDQMVMKGKYNERDDSEEEVIVDIINIEKSKRIVNLDPATVVNLVNSYNIKKHSNNIKYVLARGGESINDVANSLDLAYWQISRYNDLGSRTKLNDGEVIFIQPKRNSSSKGQYKVKAGDSLLSISQKFGVKLKKLEKYNAISASTRLELNQTIFLQKKKKQ